MQKYNLIIRILHILIALGTILQLIIGFFFHDFFKHVSPYFFMTMHKSIGLTMLFLVILLLVVRALSKPIPYPTTMPLTQKLLAKLCHIGLYLCLLAMSLSGVLALQLFQSQWQYFYWFNLPNFLATNPNLGRQLFALHNTIALVLLVLVIVHVLRAFYHRFIIKDQIMQKMF